MKILRIAASSMAIAGALLFLLLATIAATGKGVESTVAHSREIDASFRAAEQFVEKTLSAYARLPTQAEFKEWSESYPSSPYTPNGMWLVAEPFTPELLLLHGDAPRHGFVLTYWRGEWEESYVSWTKTSSLSLEADDYFLFRSQLAESLVLFGVSIALAAAAIASWPRGKNAA